MKPARRSDRTAPIVDTRHSHDFLRGSRKKKAGASVHADGARVTDPRGHERLDRLGTVASSLCAVHCAVVAILRAAFGGLGLRFLLGHEAEWAFTLVAIALASAALTLGWRRHRSLLVAALLALGMVGLLVSRGLEMGPAHHVHHSASPDATVGWTPSHSDAAAHEPDEHGAKLAEVHHKSLVVHTNATHVSGTVVGVLAGLLLLLGHLLNIRAVRGCRAGCAAWPSTG